MFCRFGFNEVNRKHNQIPQCTAKSSNKRHIVQGIVYRNTGAESQKVVFVMRERIHRISDVVASGKVPRHLSGPEWE